MSNRSFDDKYFDGILNQVLTDIEEEEIKKSEEIYLEFKGKPAFKTSLRHRWRIRKIMKNFKNENGSKKSFPMRRALVTAAVVIAVVFSTSLLASADIFRIFQWLGFYTNEYVDISLSKDYTQRIVEATAGWSYGKVYVPGLIPDGYTLEEINVTNNAIVMEYFSSDDDYFRFSLRVLGDDSLASVDNRDTNRKKLKIHGYDAVYYENGTENVLGYNTNEYYFRFTAKTLGEKELKKIAENIESLERLVVN